MAGDGIRVLVVDDNAGTVMATVKFLELSGYEARGAADGAGALSESSGWNPDVVILDLGLPDMDGFAVLEKLREGDRGRTPLAIALTGRSDEATRARAAEAGFAEFLVKPVRLETIKALVERAR